MTDRTIILVLGGYGNFGRRVVQELAKGAGLEILVAGRDVAKAAALASQHKDAAAAVKPCLLDITDGFAVALAAIGPQIVIHTCGPFQGQGYDIARACIALGCDYIDLADGRDFVTQIGQLDAEAKARGCRIISGASSVPALSAAVIDDYLPQFGALTSIDYGISTAQRTPPGLATAEGLLSYAGKSFATLQGGIMQTVYGWQGLVRRTLPQLGTRLMADCDVPDLALFPARYPQLRDIRFRAGVEVGTQMRVLAMLAALVRAGILKSLRPLARALLAIGPLFDPLGTFNSGFYMRLSGKDRSGQPLEKNFHLIARHGDGPHLPALPAIIVARKLAAARDSIPAGAQPCLGLFTLSDYLAAIGDLRVEVIRG